jgi:CRISPR-associated exonuclease Cas4
MRIYKEEEYLLLSGIQHFAFCQRQWALIHIEQQWTENYLTASGRILHKKAHDDAKFEKRGGCLTVRALKIFSARLGISGECDVVEFHENPHGSPIKYYDGLFLPYPVEYKRGKPKIDDCDKLQLCAQAICLEEMLGCEINSGALFYGEPRRRETVIFTEEIRNKLVETTEIMHMLFERQYTPKAQKGKQCNNCSLKDECLPKIAKKSEQAINKYFEDGLL